MTKVTPPILGNAEISAFPLIFTYYGFTSTRLIGRSFLMITTVQSNPSFLITGYSSSEIKKILRICSAYALRLLLH